MIFRIVAIAVFALLAGWETLSASPRIVRGPGIGFYEAKNLRGPAAQAVRSYLTKTYVPCIVSSYGEGLCNLQASTESLSLIYAGDYVVAVMAFDNDTGNVPAVRIAMWHKASIGFEFLGYKDDAIGLLTGARAVKEIPDGIIIAGIVQGPNDAFCCPTKRSAYSVRYIGSELLVAAVGYPRSRSAMR